jgi:hypothetical protein
VDDLGTFLKGSINRMRQVYGSYQTLFVDSYCYVDTATARSNTVDASPVLTKYNAHDPGCMFDIPAKDRSIIEPIARHSANVGALKTRVRQIGWAVQYGNEYAWISKRSLPEFANTGNIAWGWHYN